MAYLGRQARLREALPKARLDAVLVTHLPNIRYLCGFSGSSGALLIHGAGSGFFTDSRYTQQAKTEVQAGKVVIGKKTPLLAAAEWMGRRPCSNRSSKSTLLGIEGQYLTVASRKSLSAGLSRQVRFRDAPPLVEQARMVKDAEELSAI